MENTPKTLKEAIAIIEKRDSQIAEFKTHTKKRFYLGIQKQLNNLADEMLDPNFKVSMKREFELRGEKYVPIDNGFDALFDILVKGEAIIKAMGNFENQVFVSEKEDEKPRPLSEDSAENYLKK